MNTLTPLLNDISIILNSSDRPEFTLIQRYEIASSSQKPEFVIALIGKLIEQDRKLKALPLPPMPEGE
ncbi:TPA: hypothetical protein OTS89_001421 [Proteus mirabilis]|uniref:hypothetical protein n=1 Tax=Morganellaceae TaxID=1903414 RepID=UPI0013778A5D|nr:MULTISPECIES: hypothetical protein [Morganellaceae]NBN43878.1 hypothetical protein [Proteus sp. G4377]HCT3249667.1 hypothetical protein [Proteus mirabilis]